ncbi:MAG TPA: site-specific integrase [Candidatus Baltobacteraceae bacterium]|nr:site-specific integrase [Candidatus Baltobacteraceae bacterium]
MRCSIERRKSGRWSVRYSFTSGDGRRRFRRVSVEGTRKDAEAVAARVAHDLSRGTYADAGRLTVAQLCEEWLATALLHLAPTTYSRYKSIVDLHVNPALGAMRVRELNRRHITQAIIEWQTKHRSDKRKGPLSDTTVRHHFTTLATLLQYAVQSGYLAVNPCQNIKAPARSTAEAQPVSTEALQTLLDLADLDMGTAILMAIGTGLRRGEILGLRWADVSLDLALVRVRRSLSVSRGKLVMKTPKTKKSLRTVALPAFLITALREQEARQRERYDALAIPVTPDTPVFDWFGEVWNPTNFSSIFYRLHKKAKLSCRFHDLRHSFASMLLQHQINLKITSHLLGHASITVTGDTYAHVIQEQVHEAALVLDSALGAAVRKKVPPTTNLPMLSKAGLPDDDRR